VCIRYLPSVTCIYSRHSTQVLYRTYLAITNYGTVLLKECLPGTVWYENPFSYWSFTFTYSPVPEIIDPVFAKTSRNARFLLSENERFGLVFVKTGFLNSGTGFNYVINYKSEYLDTSGSDLDLVGSCPFLALEIRIRSFLVTGSGVGSDSPLSVHRTLYFISH
jgi:hypothetical protein